MEFVSSIRSKNMVTIPKQVVITMNLHNKDLIKCRLNNLEFISSLLDQNQSFAIVIPNFIFKKLNLKNGAKIKLSASLSHYKAKNRKELAFINFKLFIEKTQKEFNQDNFNFSKIEEQLNRYDFNLKKILFRIEEFHGRKYKFVRLPKWVKENNYALFRYNNVLFIRRVFQKNKLSVPSKFNFKGKGILEIIKIIDKKDFFTKSKQKFVSYKNRKFLDLKAVLPKRLKVNNKNVSLIVKEFPINKLIISYDLDKNKGKIKKPFLMERYIPLNLFIKFLGFYFGDGFKKNSPGIGGVNSEKSVILWLNKFLKTYFYEDLKYEVVHGDKRLTKRSEIAVKNYWGDICSAKINKLNYNKSNKNPKKFGSLKIYLGQIISRRLFVYLLEKFHKLIKKDSDLARLYLMGIGMSDMGVTYKKGKLSAIVLGHQKNNNELRKHYKDVLNSYGIKDSLVYGDGYIGLYNIKNFINFINNDMFKNHEHRKRRLINGFCMLEDVRMIKNRLGIFKKPITAEDFRKSIKINDDAYGQLAYFKKLNLIYEIPTYPKLYMITDYGKRLLEKINNS